jgi:hypothetical protein
VPGGLTLSQRLTRPDGLPSWAARLGVVALMLVTAAVAYAAGPDGDEPATPAHRPVAVSRLAGDLPIAVSERGPTLRAAAPLPALRGDRRAPRPAPAAAPEPVATAEPAATPEPTAGDTPAAAAPPVVAIAPIPVRRPAPRTTPGPTFDTSG